MSPHRLALLCWIGVSLALLGLPAPWSALAWALVTLLFLSVLAWGVASIRSPFFGRALLGAPQPGAVALTFDDGPDPNSTPALLDLLRSRGARATFFVVGEHVRSHPELARRCQAEGHELGNHSQRHSFLLNFRLRAGMRRDLAACQATLVAATGRAPRFYRPPVGLRNPAVHPVCDELELCLVGWQVRSFDTSRRAPEAVVRRVLRQVRPGGIVLLHDGGQPRERVLTITEGILRGLESRGLRPVPLSELLSIPEAAVVGRGPSHAKG